MKNDYMQIVLSSRFRDILYKINDGISNFILNLENNEDYTYQISFIDVTDDESTLSFLQVNKYNELPIEKGNGDIIWSCPARNDIRSGRLINKIASFYSAQDIEKWVNSFKSEYKNALKNIRFKVISGKDIIKFYNGKRYTRGNGSLNKSCMRHDYCADYMDLYIKNSDKIKMVILLEGEKELISGRALLWKLDTPGDTWLMDRIYVKEDSDAILFKKHAEKNGWFYKSSQTFDCTKVIKGGNEMNVDMKVYIRGDYKYFPYIDTLLYYNKKENYLSNIDDDYKNIPEVIKLREINGNDSGNENFVYDALNERFINIEDSIFCFYGDDYTHKNSAFFIKEYDEYIYPTMLRYSRYNKRFLTNTHSVFSRILNSFVMLTDVNLVFITKDNKEFDYFLKSDLNKKYAVVDNNYYIMDILIFGIYDKYYFKDEYDIKKIQEKEENQKKIIEEVINSSSYIRKLMKDKDKDKDKKLKDKSIWDHPEDAWSQVFDR